MIQPSFVTHEQAILLKDKGFIETIESYYNDKGNVAWTAKHNHNQNDDLFSRPEQWQVVEWLRVKHGIWIQVCLNGKMDRFKADIMKFKANTTYICTIDGRTETRPEYGWDTPQEAYSAAFDYILNNMI